MTKIILPTEPTAFVDFFKANYENIISEKMTEKEVVEYISSMLPFARGCNVSQDCYFWMFDAPENMPSDCRVAYVYEPTYYATATIIYAITRYETVAKIEGLSNIMPNILKGCMGRNFLGHGFDYVEGFIRAMKIFARANVMTFINVYGKEYPEFEEFIKSRIQYVKDELLSGKVRDEWTGSDYSIVANEIMKLLEGNDNTIRLFVYGTLMRGQCANYYLDGARFVGTYRLGGYAMYNLGHFPGIKEDVKESVIGEVYEITTQMLPQMDRYEGEGSLYIRKQVTVSNSEDSISAYAYIYNKEVKGSPMREKWGVLDTDRVWYACYGSNLDSERFTCYISGGLCVANGRTYAGCKKDNSLWNDSKVKEYEGELYFGNVSSSWGGKGVAFYDPAAKGSTIMRLYNISRSQLLEIQKQECDSSSWYGRIVCLGVEEGLPVYTITSENRRNYNNPSDNYIQLIKKALINECGISSDDADKYIADVRDHR